MKKHRVPNRSSFDADYYQKTTNPLGPKGFLFDRLMALTLQAIGSNPAGHINVKRRTRIFGPVFFVCL